MIQRLEDERSPAGRDADKICIWVGDFISFMENYLVSLSLEKLFSLSLKDLLHRFLDQPYLPGKHEDNNMS